MKSTDGEDPDAWINREIRELRKILEQIREGHEREARPWLERIVELEKMRMRVPLDELGRPV